jgi:hypothetical protein
MKPEEWHRIKAMRPSGSASKDSTGTQQQAGKWTMKLQSIKHILGTGWNMTA